MERRSIQRFQILETLGGGGMGTVYRARDPQLERDVAIKVLHATDAPVRAELETERTIDLRKGGAKRDDLLQEARMMAQLSHPNVVPIFEVGLDEANAVFVVMEYIAGDDLRKWLRTPRTPADIARVFAQAGHGLAAAHARGIVHRDFKPDNVMIGLDGRARVTDFGLAKLGGASDLVRAVRVAGTPKYMAPELYRGAPTVASDVFAFCTACIEAFGDAASDKQRAMFERGVANEPEDRPPLGDVIAVLEGAPPRRRTWMLAGAAATAAIAIGGVVALRGDDGLRCAPIESPLAQRRAQLTRTFGREVDQLIAMFDGRIAAIEQLHREVCEAEEAKQITSAQAQQQSACLAIRAVELGVVIDRLVAKRDLLRAEAAFGATSLPASCKSLSVTASEPAAVGQLYERLAKVGDLPAEKMIDELVAIEAAAKAAGDPELGAKAAVALGQRYRNADRISVSDETLQRAFQEAQAIGSTDVAALAIAERIMAVVNSQDVVQTKTLGSLALDLAAKPTTTPRTRLRVQRVIARSSLARGEHRAAVEIVRNALGESQERNRDVEMLLRLDLAEALIALDEDLPSAIAQAAHAVEHLRSQGEQSNNYGYALNILAKCYLANDDVELALETRRRALAVYTALYPATHAFVLDGRVFLGEALLRAGELEAAYAELADAVELASKAPQLKRSYPAMLSVLARAEADLARPEAIARYEQAVDLLSSTLGGDHPRTLAERVNYAKHLFELGRLDDVERIVASVEQSYARKAESHDKRPALLRGSLAADVALARKRPADAEALARRALDELAEHKAPAYQLAIARRRLGEALLARGKNADAHRELATALADASKRDLRTDELAAYRIALAAADAALGKGVGAYTAAKTLLEADLAKFPAAHTTRARAKALLR